jgi:hypothetical protein
MGGIDDADYYARDAAEEDFVNQAIQNISQDNVRSYLGRYGDAIDARVQNCLQQARELRDTGYNQSSLVSAMTAIEITVRFLLIRPLLQGAFLSDEWADFVTRRITSGRTAEDKELLPRVLDAHAIDIRKIRLPDGKLLWESFVKEVGPKRNRVIHAGEPATPTDAETAIACATHLYEDVVLPLAKTLGFTLEITGRWSKTGRTDDRDTWGCYTTSNPFE